MKIDTEDLIASSDISRVCGVTPAAVSNWAARYETFPRPLAVVANGRTSLYSKKAVMQWYIKYRMSPELMNELRSEVQSG